MKSQRTPHLIGPVAEPSAAVDLETFVDRMHAQDIMARCAFDIFQCHGSPLADWESWIRAESEVLQGLTKGAA